MKKGVAIPRGRMALPREPKNMGSDRILVFAEGRHLEEAKKAGADIVGGPELCDGVRAPYYPLTLLFNNTSIYYLRLIDYFWPTSCNRVLVYPKFAPCNHTKNGSFLGSQGSHALGTSWYRYR